MSGMEQQPEAGGTPALSDDEEKAELLEPVLAALDQAQLPILAKRILQARQPENVPEPSVGRPIFGSYHVVFPLTFESGTRWAVKIPVNGSESAWNDISSSALSSEAETMRLLRRETTIPVPDVFDFSSTTENPLRCPYILMSFVTGYSLYDIWFGHRLRGTSAVENHANRVRVLEGVASAMAQLGKFSSRTGGSPRFAEGGSEIVGSGPFRQVDHKAMLDRWFVHADPAEDPIYFKLEPYEKAKQYYTAMLDAHPEDQRVLRGMELLLRQFIDWIPDTQGPNPFVLSHPDFDIQNFIVSANGDLLGIIDWDGVALVPRSIGNERYPGWLTRDWDASMYGYNPSMDEGEEPRGVWEDSPATLAEYRRVYHELMAGHRGDGQPNFCRMSLITDNLAIAASDPACRGQILRKLVEEVWNVRGVEGPTYLELTRMFTKGDLGDALKVGLKAGFEAILAKEGL